MTTDFSLRALYDAIDEQRRTRGLSWAEAVRQISGASSGDGSRRLAVSTVVGLRVRRVVEADGVLAMLRWLDRSPESFVPGSPLADIDAARLPDVRPRVLRMDTRRLHAALNAARVQRGLTWKEMSAEIPGTTVAMLTGLAENQRAGFPHVTRCTAWLRQPLAAFTHATRR